MTDTISRHLGQKSAYKTEYDPTILVREDRQSNRTYLGIHCDTTPFDGFDIWNAYEVSALNDNGLPFSFVVRLSYSCNNEYIVESKSLKLYFNSFAMTHCGKTGDDVKEYIRVATIRDLSELLNTQVLVNVWHQKELIDSAHIDADEAFNMSVYTTLEHAVSKDLMCDKYTEDMSLLKIVDDDLNEWSDYHSSSLVSCCKVTGQPDSGDIFISIKGGKKPTIDSLLQYIVSFRGENHFHEEICEAVFKRLLDVYNPEALFVRCFYSRRGGIDINPYRYFGEDIDDSLLIEERIGQPVKLPRQ